MLTEVDVVTSFFPLYVLSVRYFGYYVDRDFNFYSTKRKSQLNWISGQSLNNMKCAMTVGQLKQALRKNPQFRAFCELKPTGNPVIPTVNVGRKSSKKQVINQGYQQPIF